MRTNPQNAQPSTALIDAAELKKQLADGYEIALVDVREQGECGEGHPFHAVPLAYSRLELDVGRLIPNLAARIVVLDGGHGDTRADRARRRLHALGYSQVLLLKNGAQGWRTAGFTLFKGVHVPSKTFGELIEHVCRTPSVTAIELKAMMDRGANLLVLDGRSSPEHRTMSIPTAVSCPNAELAYRLHRLAPDNSTTIVVNCAGRTRSIIGAQSLLNLGVSHHVVALENGTQGWFLEGFPLEHGSQRTYPEVSPSDSPLQAARLSAQALASDCGVRVASPTQLTSWRDDPLRTTFFFDIRTPEEYNAGSASGARHVEGGQLIQGTDLHIGVRHARVLLYDTDGIRAPLVGSWLSQMAYEVYLVTPELASGAASCVGASPVHAAVTLLPQLDPGQLHQFGDGVHLIDLRPSMAYRALHLTGAIWATRCQLPFDHDEVPAPIVFVAADPRIAALAASELSPDQQPHAYCMTANIDEWKHAGLPTEATPQSPPDEACIDFLFFVHDRHEGNREAARRYLAWEMNLVSQLDDQEKGSFRLRPAV